MTYRLLRSPEGFAMALYAFDHFQMLIFDDVAFFKDLPDLAEVILSLPGPKIETLTVKDGDYEEIATFQNMMTFVDEFPELVI